MSNDKKLKAFVPATNADKAKAFYKDILGLNFLSEDGHGLEFECNGSLLRIALVCDLKPQPFTVLGWNVNDIHAAIKELNQKGITFERYDFFEQDELGVWSSPSGAKVAWFKDHDENILSLTQHER